MFNPSKYQKAIFDFIQNDSGNAFIDALAGSGKTTTLIECLKLLPKSASVCFLAFNKKIAMELESRVPSHVQAMTLNSFGFKICYANAGVKRIDIDSDKTSYILRFKVLNVDKNNKEQCTYFYSIKGAITRLVALAKANLILKPTQKDFETLAENYDIRLEKIEDLTMFWQHVHATFLACIDCKWKMDFDDQLFLPIYYNWPIPTFDYLMVDEAQDLNPCQIELVLRASGN